MCVQEVYYQMKILINIAKGLKENFYTENMEDPDILSQKTLSYALYPKVYEDYCRHFEAYNDVTGLESHVYFYGLRKGEETTLKLDEGKYLIIKFIDMTEPDEDGYRLLDFEVNGSIREIKVLDKNLEVKTDRRVKADKLILHILDPQFQEQLVKFLSEG